MPADDGYTCRTPELEFTVGNFFHTWSTDFDAFRAQGLRVLPSGPAGSMRLLPDCTITWNTT